MSEETADDRELRTLMTQYQAAQASAIDELVRRISPPLLRYFSASSSGRSDPQDLLQECWLRIHRSRHTYRASEPVLPWIYAIARHTRLDAYRKRRRLESREIRMDTLPERVHPEAHHAPPEAEAFEQLIAGLPESQREVVVMLKVMGLSLEDIAKATSCTVGSVKQKAHRAYEALRRTLAKDHEHAT